MSEVNNTPTYNLKVVVQETGLKPDTLRVWERRYGLPNPDRSAGGHRLYSDRDIATIKWLLARKEEGLSISRAVALWQQTVEQGEDPLAPEPSPSDFPAAPPAVHGETLRELRQEWVDACLAFDEQKAEQVLTQAFAQAPPETVSVEVLQKGIASIGVDWYGGRATVQQEHFASVLVTRRLDALILAAPPPSRPGRILIACPPKEDHTIGALLLTFFLRRRGLDVLFLGADTPADRVENLLETTTPRLVILSAQLLPTAGTLLDVALALQKARVPLAFGGEIFNKLPALRPHIPGQFLGEQIQQAVRTVEKLLGSPRQTLPPAGASVYPPAELLHYQERRAAIESQVWATQQNNLPHSAITTANANLAHDIEAALKFGDLSLISCDIQWIRGLLGNVDQPIEHLEHYLRIYATAAEQQLDERGDSTKEWLAALATQSPETLHPC